MKLLIAVLLLAQFAQAEVIFDGYYKMTSGGLPIGYFVQRFEIDKSTQNFKSIYFVTTQLAGKKSSESLKAESTKDFAPISYQYTMTDGSILKTIDATFKGDVMIAKVSDGKKTQTLNRKLKKGSFLSTFLGYLMLSKGLKDKTTYNYFALAEEDAQLYAGKTDVLEKTQYKGLPAFKMKNTFKDVAFESLMSDTGEVLVTTSNMVNVATELVPTRQMAVANISPNEKALQLLFGEVPTGQKNVLNKK